MEELITSLIIFVIFYLAYVIFVINRKDKLNKLKKGMIVNYIVTKYQLDLKTINFKVFAHMVALSTAFIMSTTFFIISFFDNYLIKVLLCFVVLLPLQFIMYMIIGKAYQKNHKK